MTDERVPRELWPDRPDPEAAARQLVREIHDEVMASIPDVRILGRSLRPAPWPDERVDRLAASIEHTMGAIAAAMIEGYHARLVEALRPTTRGTGVRKARKAS